MTRFIFIVVFLLAAAPLAAAGQSLAEVAKQEEARRKTVKEPAKVYTNNDLRPDISKAPPASDSAAPPADANASGAAAKPADADGKSKGNEPAKDQAYWTERMKAARGALERSRIFADALKSRINALTTDFINRDDPAQRSQIELERQRATAELERVTKEMAEQTKAIADIEEEARKAGVPPGWLR